MSGHGLVPRHVRVWVPAQKPTRHLYLHDGQNLFDPESMGGGWRLQESLGRGTLAIDNTPVFHWYEPGAEHDEASGADRVGYPLSFFESL